MLERYREAVRKTPEIWPSDWILYYENSVAHKAFYVMQFLAQKSSTTTEHPPSGCFQEQSASKGRRFQDTKDKKKNESHSTS
jgi:hypothetical protein